MDRKQENTSKDLYQAKISPRQKSRVLWENCTSIDDMSFYCPTIKELFQCACPQWWEFLVFPRLLFLLCDMSTHMIPEGLVSPCWNISQGILPPRLIWDSFTTGFVLGFLSQWCHYLLIMFKLLKILRQICMEKCCNFPNPFWHLFSTFMKTHLTKISKMKQVSHGGKNIWFGPPSMMEDWNELN